MATTAQAKHPIPRWSIMLYNRCPETFCDAGPGEYCKKPDGTVLDTSCHFSRLRVKHWYRHPKSTGWRS